MTDTKRDVRGFRKLSMRWIYFWIFLWWSVLSVWAVFAAAAIPVIVFMSILIGWLMGVLTERNDWDGWYRKRKSEDLKR